MSRGFGRVRCSCHSPIPPVTPNGLRRSDGGDRRRAEDPLPCLRPHRCFVAAYPAETTEHSAMATTRRCLRGGVPRSILYDNTKLAVARILGDGKRQRTRVFTELQSHYLFEEVRPAGQGQRQGHRRGTGRLHPAELPGPSRVPMSFAALNDALAEQCRRRQASAAAGPQGDHRRAERDRQVLLPLPPAPYDACDKRPGRASSLSLVRYRSNDYSVPVAYGHRDAHPGLRR